MERRMSKSDQGRFAIHNVAEFAKHACFIRQFDFENLENTQN